MMRRTSLFASLLLLGLPLPAIAQAGEPEHAVGGDLFYSVDADDTEVMRIGFNIDPHYRSEEDRLGIRLERARFNPLGLGWRNDERIYLRAARSFGRWNASGSIGTDGDTILGSASIYQNTPLRPEFFVEREIVETPQGLARGIYYTFAGASVDLPVDERNVFTAFAGVQDFTGDNVRTHLRANYVHVVKPDWGLSAQLRGRYFRNSDPREFDYYSPRWYAQILPLLQVRRFSGGWRYLAAAGIGVQRDSDSDWRRSSYLNAQASGPLGAGWRLTASALYSETPTTSGLSYDYGQFTLGLTRTF